MARSSIAWHWASTSLARADVGISKASAHGPVYNLKKLEDFNGTYTEVTAGATIGGGTGATTIQNHNGVMMNLMGTAQGLKFKLSVDGIKMTLKGSEPSRADGRTDMPRWRTIETAEEDMHRTSQCWAVVMVLTSLWLLSPGRAVEAGEPQERIQQMLTSLLAVLTDDTLKAPAQRQERNKRIAQVVSQSFDVKEMARRSMGQYWHRLTPTQQGEFVQLFSDLLLQSLVKRIAYRATTNPGDYGSIPNAIRYLRESIDPDGDASVQTEMTYTQDPTPEDIEYLLLRKDGTWWVYDVVAEGASMVTNYRTQFAQIMRQESFADLMQRLKTSQQ